MALGDTQRIQGRLKGSALLEDILNSQRDIDAQLDSTSNIDFLLRRNQKPTPLNRLAQGIQHRENITEFKTIQIDNRTAQIDTFIQEAPELETEIRKLDESGAKMREIDNLIQARREKESPEARKRGLGAFTALSNTPIGFVFDSFNRGVVNAGKFFSSNIIRGVGSMLFNSIVNNPTSTLSAVERQQSGESLSELFFDTADNIEAKLDDLVEKKPEDLTIKDLSDIVDPKKIVSLVLESIPTTAALVAATLASGGVATLPIIFTSVTGAETKELMEREDLSLPQKLSTAQSIAAIEAVLETVGLGAITKSAKQGLIRNVTRIARGEGGTELAQESQAILQKEGIEAFKAEETWAQVLSAGVVGAISGVTIGTAIQAAQQGRPTEEGKPAPVQEKELDPEFVEAMQELASQGAQEQRVRNPESFIEGETISIKPPEVIKEVTEKPVTEVKGAPKSEKVKIPTEDTATIYNEAREFGKAKAFKRWFNIDFTSSNNLNMLDKAATSISSNLKAINTNIGIEIVNMEAFQRQLKSQWADNSKSFLVMLTDIKKKLGRGERFALDLALSNGNIEETNKILTEYDSRFQLKEDPVEAHKQLQSTLVQIRELALNNGIEIGNVENFFPRVVKNLNGLTKLIRGTKHRGVYDEALRKATADKGRQLAEEEQLQIIDRTIGYHNQSSLSSSSLKERRINTLNAELYAQYFRADQALDIYFQRLSSAIAQQEFFKSLGIEPETKDLSAKTLDIDPQNVANDLLSDGLELNIAKLVQKGRNDGTLTLENENQLNFLLNARFNIKPLAKPLRYAKTFSTGLLLARGLSSPVKQMADIARAAYDSGIYSTGVSLVRSAVRLPKLTLQDIGVEDISAALVDISGSGKIVDTLLKVNLFRTFDAIGKETLVNAKIDKIGREIRRNKLNEQTAKLIDDIFGKTPGLKTQLMEDLKNDVKSQDVKLLAFHLLSRTQPISLSELPPWYFTSGNGRVFFTLKTFQAKRLDDIRETALRDIFGQGKTKSQRAKGMQRLITLMAYLTMGELATDEMIRWMRGQSSAQDFPDKVTEALLKVIGTNKYALNKIERNGVFEALTQEFLGLPTTVIDEFLSDFKPLFTDEEYTVDGVKSLRNIPLVGESLYFWFGAGEIKNVKNYVRSVREELKERRFTEQERFAVRATLLRYAQNNPETLSSRSLQRLYKDIDKNATDLTLPESTGQKYWEIMLNEIKQITALPETVMK